MKRNFTKLLAVLAMLAFLMPSLTALGQTTTYTFSSKSWAASPANWTSGKDGNQMQSGRGVQVTTGVSGANATSPVSFTNVSQVVITYSTNASAGAGSISIQIGSNTAVSQDVTKTGGTTDRTLTYNFSPYQTGNVKFTVTCTTNSIYIKSIAITTSSASTYTVTAAKETGISTAYVAAGSSFSGTSTSVNVSSGGSATFQATVASGYTFDGWYNGSNRVSQNTTYTQSNITSALTLTAKATVIPTHTVTFSINGNTSNTATIAEGEAITFPNNIADINDYTFMGWVASTIAGTTNTAPNFVTSATMGTQDVTYYACFAEVEGSGPDTYEQLNSNNFDANAKYVIGATQESNNSTMWYFYSYSDVNTNISWGPMTSNPSNNAPIQFTLSGSASALVAQDDSNNYLKGLTAKNFQMSSTSTTIALTSNGQILNTNGGAWYLRHNYNGGGGGLRWYNGTTGTAAYFYKVIPGTTYSNYCTTVSTIITTPTVATNSTATSTTTTTITCGGTVTSTGGAATTRGICYMEGTTGNPTTSNTCVAASGTTTTNNSTFEVTLNGLSAGTSYRCRAYATNSEGTGYGTTYTFRTDYSITVQSNNTDWGTATLTGPTTITASANQGYVISTTNPYTVTNGTATVTDNGDNTFSVVPSSNCTIQINFEAIPTHTAYFSVNGAVTTSQSFAEGASIVFPNDPADIDDKTFVGWITNTINGTTNTAPTFVNTANATMGNSDITYYACFAIVEESEGSYTLDYENESGLSSSTSWGSYGTAFSYTAADGSIWVVKAYKNQGMQLNIGKDCSIKVPTCPENITTIEITCSLSKALGFSANDYTGSGTITYLAEGTDNTSQTLVLTAANVKEGYIVPKSGATSITKIVVKYSNTSYSDYCTTVITAPSNLNVTNLLANSATLNWTGQQSSYEVRYRTVTQGEPQTVTENITFEEGFESGSLPNGWDNTSYVGKRWLIGAGSGYTSSPISAAATGSKNAYFYSNTASDYAYLITPALDMSNASNATLTFNYVNPAWSEGNFAMTVHYRINGGSWIQLATYESAQATWTEKTINLTTLGEDYQIAFHATGYNNDYGYGVGIDDVRITYTNTTTETPLIYGNWVTISPATSPLNITGLTADTDYEWQVRGIDGNNYTNWVSTNFHTPVTYNVYLTISPANGGTITREGGTWDGDHGVYSDGETATLTAAANIGYTFNNWIANGTVASTATYSTTITGNVSIVANFTKNTYPITVAANPTEGGTVTGGGTYEHGQSCTVTASATVGYTFTGWYENNTLVSSNANFFFSVEGARNLEARFTLNNYVITVSANPIAGGNITHTGGSWEGNTGIYNHGDIATLTASANTGYTFNGWYESNALVYSPATYTINPVTSVHTLEARYTLNTHTLTINYMLNGNQADSPVIVTLAYGTEYTYVSPSIPGYTPDQPTVSGTMPDNDVTINVNYSINSHNVIYSYTGTVPADAPALPATVSYTYGATVPAAAVPTLEGYTFYGWTGEVSTMPDNDVNVTGYWTINSYSVTYAYTGTVPSGAPAVPATQTYNYGATVPAATVPTLAGYTFSGWNGEVSTMPAHNVNVTGSWTVNSYTLTITYTYQGGGQAAATHSEIVDFGDNYEVVSPVIQGYTPSQATVSGTMPANDVTVNVVYSIATYTINTVASPTAGGTITGGGTYTHGTTATLEATANTGYTFNQWSDDVATNPRTVTVTGDATYTAVFTPNNYTIATAADPTVGGTVTGGGTYSYGSTATLTATANPGYNFSQWSDGNSDNPRTVTINGPATYTAQFTQENYTITVTAGAGGTASGNGTYHYGDNATVTATPNTGYVFQNWTESGTVVSTDASYSFTVEGTRSLTANFMVAPPTVILNNIASGDITKTSVTVSGSVSYTGTITEHGFCWSTSPNPVVAEGWYARVGTGTGNFSNTITNLQPNTLYYVRAYASNDGQQTFVYSAEKSIYTLVDVTTLELENADVHTIDATFNGRYASDNNANVSCGFVYSMTSDNATPTIGGTGCTTVAAESAGTPFSANATGLTGSTNYSMRAYATNESGTTYGVVVTFTTDRYYSVSATVTPSEGGLVSFSPAGDGYSSLSNDVTIGSGTTNQRNFPLAANQETSYCEMLYRHTNEMVAGDITKISFHKTNSNGSFERRVSIYIKEVANTTLSNIIGVTASDLYYDGPISCADNAWAEITLDSAFTYNGTSNLLVAVYYYGQTTVSTSRSWYSTNMGYNCCKGYYGSSVNPYSPTTTCNTNLTQTGTNMPNTKFTIRAANGNAEWYHYGASTTLTATANPGYVFDNWTENGLQVSTSTTYTVSNITADHTLTANFRTASYKRFITGGNWNYAANWSPTGVPTANDDVVIEAHAVIPSNCVAVVDEIISITQNTGSITIEDGGQLLHNNSVENPVTLTIEKNVEGYGSNNFNSNLGYHLYSSPTNVSTADFASSTYGFTDASHDLYYFKYDNIVNGTLLEWVNVSNDMNLVRNRGYIYASMSNTTLGVTGPVMASNVDQTVQLAYTAGSTLRFNGWNLIGNPFVCNAYVTSMNGGTVTPLNFYVLNQAGSDFILPGNVNQIAPTGAVMVKATAPGETVVYSRDNANNGGRDGLLDIAVAPRQEHPDRSGEGLLDRARICFGKGSDFEKFQLDPRHTKVYIPRSGKDYSVVYTQPIGVVPVNFMAESNGDYTISVNANDVNFNYLHLVDNMTDADIDLLVNPDYTFSARTNDQESRFKIVFATTDAGDADGDASSANFAFYTNGTWIVYSNGDATMQIVDVLGHVLSSERISGTVSKAIHATPGIYIIRLIQGNNVKTQKIVVER